MDWKNLFLTYDGRVNRQPFWIGNLILVGINIVASLLGAGIGGMGGNLIAGAIVLATLYPSICLGIKRWHDRDKSGWWILIVLVPLVGSIWYFVEVGCLRGTPGPNRFGEDPLA